RRYRDDIAVGLKLPLEPVHVLVDVVVVQRKDQGLLLVISKRLVLYKAHLLGDNDRTGDEEYRYAELDDNQSLPEDRAAFTQLQRPSSGLLRHAPPRSQPSVPSVAFQRLDRRE